MRSKGHRRWVGSKGKSGRVLGQGKEFRFSSECECGGKLSGGFKQ